MEFRQDYRFNDILDEGVLAQFTTLEHFEKYAKMIEEIGKDKNK
jgi:hypothetical protein